MARKYIALIGCSGNTEQALNAAQKRFIPQEHQIVYRKVNNPNDPRGYEFDEVIDLHEPGTVKPEDHQRINEVMVHCLRKK